MNTGYMNIIIIYMEGSAGIMIVCYSYRPKPERNL
jgi:hypothetical protein